MRRLPRGVDDDPGSDVERLEPAGRTLSFRRGRPIPGNPSAEGTAGSR
jgi:hypothetical protein